VFSRIFKSKKIITFLLILLVIIPAVFLFAPSIPIVGETITRIAINRAYKCQYKYEIKTKQALTENHGGEANDWQLMDYSCVKNDCSDAGPSEVFCQIAWKHIPTNRIRGVHSVGPPCNTFHKDFIEELFIIDPVDNWFP